MKSEGAANINGDAFKPYYDTPGRRRVGGQPRACYDADNYYNYAVEMPAGASERHGLRLRPVFCAVQSAGHR